ncbi:MAG: TRAM domain-containing protein [Acidobacteriota bacterium]
MRRPAPNLAIGSRIQIRAEELVAGGEALARLDGFPIFVPGLYPGDLAVVELAEVKAGFARATAVEIVEASVLRRESPCPVAHECGGCDWTSLRLDEQLRAKRRILLESLRRVGKFPATRLPSVTVYPSPLNYRIRSRLHMKNGAMGFYAERSHRVVPLPAECEVVGPNVLRDLEQLRSLAQKDDGSIETFERDHLLTISQGGELEVSIEVRGIPYLLSTASFFQVNRHLAGTMIDLVTAQAAALERRDLALDLYAGVGFFALPLAEHFKEIIAVESSPASSRYARKNAAAFSSIAISTRTSEDFLRSFERQADFTMVDPPRAGLSVEVIERISSITREKICYLSCDPVTFSRDASRLERRGWRLTTLDLLDLFPNTHHIETLSSFERVE